MKLLIVDDEYYFRESLKKSIKWSALDITICGEADDGLKAFNKIKKLNPDIVLVDINMPKMNGLELIKKIKEENQNIKFIILSGYEEFEYAQKALELGVLYYLLKPIDENKLFDILQKVVMQIKIEKFEEYRREVEEKEHDRFTLQYYIKRLLFKKSDYENSIVFNALLKQNCSLIGKLPICISVGKIEKEANYSVGEIDSFCNYVFNQAASFFDFTFGFCIDNEHRPVFLCTNSGIENIAKAFSKLGEFVYKKKNVRFCFGIGMPQNSFSKIYVSYTQSIQSLSKRILGDENKNTITYVELNNENTDTFHVTIEMRNKLTLMLNGQEEKEIIIFLETIKSKIKNLRLRKDSLEIIGINLILPCVIFIEKEQLLYIDEINKYYFSIFDSIKKINEINELFDLIESFYQICWKFSKEKIGPIPEAIKKVTDYIETNYDNSMLSIDEISDKVGRNYNYLCVLFKKHMGVTINEYILDFRMQKAMTLIDEGNINVGELADAVGFSNVSYFTKCFRKKFSCPPSSFLKK